MPASASAVLVVDDDRDLLQIARLVLRAQRPGLSVALCARAEEAVDAAALLPPGGLVLLDRVLAGVESYPLLRVLRERRPDLSVVMLSAAMSSVDRAYAIACGASEALEKPASLADWRGMIAALGLASPAGAPRDAAPAPHAA